MEDQQIDAQRDHADDFTPETDLRHARQVFGARHIHAHHQQQQHHRGHQQIERRLGKMKQRGDEG